jgi:excisionase family DNA binding protein
MERHLHSRKQAAAMLGVSTSTLDRLTRAGHVAAVRIGPRTVRYTAEAIAQAIRPKASA